MSTFTSTQPETPSFAPPCSPDGKHVISKGVMTKLSHVIAIVLLAICEWTVPCRPKGKSLRSTFACRCGTLARAAALHTVRLAWMLPCGVHGHPRHRAALPTPCQCGVAASRL